MKKLLQAKFSVSFIVIILLFFGFNWISTEKAISFSEPKEALLSLDPNLLLIPGYKVNDQSLYFFIKDKQELGVTFLHEGIFGWKTGEIRLTPIGEMKNDEDYQVYDNFFVYGLSKNAENTLIKVNDKEAKILDLQMLEPSIVKEYGLEGMYIWYLESDIPLVDGKIEHLNKNTGEVTNSTKFIVIKASTQ